MVHYVLGGAGFIGSHLVHELLTRDPDARIIVLDNFVTGSRRNIDWMPGPLRKRVAIEQVNLTDHLAFDRWLVTIENRGIPEPQRVWHLASPASPPAYRAHRRDTLLVNTWTTQRILDEFASDEFGPHCRVLFASTSEVYGDPEVHPQPEEYVGHVKTFGDRACYDEAKRCGEAIMDAAHRAEADVRVARIFNTYGPRMSLDDGRVVPNFIRALLERKPLPLYGSGSQTRTFCYVSDMVDGLIRLMQHEGGDAHLPVNLGGREEVTVRTLGSEMALLLRPGFPANFESHPLPEDDPKRRRPVIGRARRMLGWTPKVELSEGLRLTLDWASHEMSRRSGVTATG